MLLAATTTSSSAPVAPRWPEAPVFANYVLAGASAPAGDRVATSTTCRGEGTTLESAQLRNAIPRHDQDLGETTLTLRDSKGSVLLSERVTELWTCLAYDPRSKRYLVTSTNEHGVRVRMRRFAYVVEVRRVFVDSTLAAQSFEALAVKLSPQQRYLALIADRSDGKSAPVQLYVLDLDDDHVRSLGRPPAPPPLQKSDWPERDMMYAWGAPERHFGELEEAVFTFTDEHTLRVGFGRDTYRARAKQRQVRTFTLR